MLLVLFMAAARSMGYFGRSSLVPYDIVRIRYDRTADWIELDNT